MKTKHRRQFFQNNRNTRHFSPLSAEARRSLSELAKSAVKLGVSLLATTLSQAQPADLTSQLNGFLEESRLAHFESTPQEDIEFKIQWPPSLSTEKTCSDPIEFNWRGQLKAGKNTLNAQCSSPNWQIYLPVSLSVFRDVVITSTSLGRANRIKPENLKRIRMDTAFLKQGYFTEPEKLDGYQILRTVKVGQVLTPYIVRAPFLVERGDWVTVITGKGALTVTITAEAMKNGSLGQQIPLKNIDTQRRFKAWVIKKGVVTTKKTLIQSAYN